MVVLDIAGKKILFVKYGDRITASVPTCPHAGAELCLGWLDGRGNVVCPLHGYHFDTRTGHNTSGEEYRLKVYPLENRDGGLYIGLDEGL